MVGRKTTTRRWLSIKQKYNVKEQRKTCVASDIVLKINLKEKLKSEARLLSRERTKTELIERLSTPKDETPLFFKCSKRKIRYLEDTEASRNAQSC
jgi:hypothetical protein